jgi:hypothetical protein
MGESRPIGQSVVEDELRVKSSFHGGCKTKKKRKNKKIEKRG